VGRGVGTLVGKLEAITWGMRVGAAVVAGRRLTDRQNVLAK
jgi:hypothetical protein